MTQAQTYFILIILSLFSIQGQCTNIAPFSSYSGNCPGNTYDIGTLNSTNIIKVNLNWTMIVDKGNLPIILLYSVNGSSFDQVPLNLGELTYPTATSLLFQKSADLYSKFYIVVEMGSNDGQADYDIKIYVDGQLIKTDRSTVFGMDHIPSFKLTIQNKCKLKITFNINATLTQLLVIDGFNSFAVHENSNQLIAQFDNPGTYYVLMLPNQNNGYYLPITELVPYTLTLQTYCDNYCGTTISPSCNTINCQTIAYAIPIQGNPNQCACIQYFAFNTYTDKCVINCSLVSNATGPMNGSISTCACATAFSFNLTSFACGLNCSLVLHSTGPFGVYTQTCSCAVSFNFTGGQVCLINCTQIGDALAAVPNTTDKCTCRNKFYFVSTSSICQINCSLVSNSIGPEGTTRNLCKCKNLFYFDYVQASCILNCSNISYALNLVNSTSTCSCLSGFIWKSTTLACQINCTAVAHSTGVLVANTIDKCICEPHYYFDNTTRSCIINCSSIPHAINLQGSTTSCSCIAKFNFNSSTNQCIIDCALVVNTVGPVANSTEKCDCTSPLIFNLTIFQCVELNCSMVDHAIGNGVQNQTCQCVKHFYFTADYTCNINCSEIGYAVSQVAGTTNLCSCQWPFYFNQKDLICIINCSLVANALPTYITNTVCKCQKGYNFDSITHKCQSVCGDSFVVGTQQCDDGNRVDTDSCSNSCKVQAQVQKNLSVALLAGVIGGIVLLVVTIAVILCVVCKKKPPGLVAAADKTTGIGNQVIVSAQNLQRAPLQ